ncbi:hypothetical protein FK220_013600 [Flavobacteriaceae bacterium TP-CH-4]|uniref:Putative zinc-finger domain-containing protein n=1 Tax=Pelagihabitans pacificus TaxID=2696054 RepID=A0A967AU98_9FLAO|nr:zf-HC2 domain-containing protein [Pelagihabitans pacificus]NHF60383.1 hypothetical protein [Pelagihabitans pacificus]
MMTEKKHITDLLPDYLDQTLDNEQKQQVEAHLRECSACASELEEFKLLFEAMAKEETLVPTERVRSTFLEHLEQEKRQERETVALSPKDEATRFPWANILKVAASIVLLVGAFMFGKYQQETESEIEIVALKTEGLEAKQTAMLSLMENQSASKRIQGVGYINGFTDPDDAIVEALVDRMHHDENANVRLAALEALSEFTKSEIVKEAFIKALSTEKNPSIQIALIQNLVKVQEKKAAGALKELLEQEGTQPFVKAEIKQVLPEII